MHKYYLDIVIPVYNEEKRLQSGVEKLLEYLRSSKISDYVITIADNTSTDNTKSIAKAICEENERIRYLYIDCKGVGIAFRRACEIGDSHIIGYMDVDMSTDLSALEKMIFAFEDNETVDIVNGSRYSKDSELIGRSPLRNFVGYALIVILKISFRMKATDAICGFKFFKHQSVDILFKEASNECGWFLIIELLLRAERKGFNIKELPVRWIFDDNSKVNIIKVTLNYLKNIMLLKRKFVNESKSMR